VAKLCHSTSAMNNANASSSWSSNRARDGRRVTKTPTEYTKAARSDGTSLSAATNSKKVGRSSPPSRGEGTCITAPRLVRTRQYNCSFYFKVFLECLLHFLAHRCMVAVAVGVAEAEAAAGAVAEVATSTGAAAAAEAVVVGRDGGTLNGETRSSNPCAKKAAEAR